MTASRKFSIPTNTPEPRVVAFRSVRHRDEIIASGKSFAQVVKKANRIAQDTGETPLFAFKPDPNVKYVF